MLSAKPLTAIVGTKAEEAVREAIASFSCKDKDETEATGVSGKELLDLCMDKIYKVHTLIGGRYVLIECGETEKVVDFYRANSFEYLQLDKNDGYLQMIRRL